MIDEHTFDKNVGFKFKIIKEPQYREKRKC